LELKENESSLLTCTLNYQGNGTKKLKIELSEFVLRNKNQSPLMGLVPTIIIIINGQSKVMTNQKTSNSPLKWKCKINNLIEKAPSQQNQPDNCSATSLSPFKINILIDFLCSNSTVSRNVIAHITEGKHCFSNFLMKDKCLTDVTFQVMDQTITAHSTTLAAKSSVFSRMFQQLPAVNNKTILIDLLCFLS